MPISNPIVLCAARARVCVFFSLQLGFAQQLDDMIAEAEQVATELYGETQSPQDMQVQQQHAQPEREDSTP